MVPLTLSEPFAIGAAVTTAAELTAAAELVAFAGVPEVPLAPSDEKLVTALLGDDVVEWVVEAAAASSMEVVASRGSTGYR